MQESYSLARYRELSARTVQTGRREKEGAEVVAEINKTGGTAAFVRADCYEER
jgi:hypothetical protein